MHTGIDDALEGARSEILEETALHRGEHIGRTHNPGEVTRQLCVCSYYSIVTANSTSCSSTVLCMAMALST